MTSFSRDRLQWLHDKLQQDSFLCLKFADGWAKFKTILVQAICVKARLRNSFGNLVVSAEEKAVPLSAWFGNREGKPIFFFFKEKRSFFLLVDSTELFHRTKPFSLGLSAAMKKS